MTQQTAPRYRITAWRDQAQIGAYEGDDPAAAKDAVERYAKYADLVITNSGQVVEHVRNKRPADLPEGGLA